MTAQGAESRLDLPRIEVLGPPAICCGTVRTPVRGHPARLLVTLAASGACSLDRLAEALWGDEPPPTHRSALHVHLGALRRAIAAGGEGCAIVRSEGGYALQRDGWELDADLALDVVAAAREELERDPGACVRLAEAALRLWRGTPFAVDGDVVDAPSWHQLEAARRDAEELRVEGLLRVGDAAAAEAAALAYVGAEPLRENRWGQLLRARYLAGRTADALSTYQGARRALVEALGIEPGRELQDLEAAVLTHDRARLRLNRVDDEGVAGPPSVAGPLVGRDRELERVAAAVASGHRMVLLGPPGVGKTRLAIEVARRLGTDAVAWVDLREASAGASAQTCDQLLEWGRRHPDGLIVLDNAETARDDATAVLRALSGRSAGAGILATSRVPLDASTQVELLQPLALPSPGSSDEDIEAAPAVQVLRAALAELAPAASLDATAAALIARRAGGLPLVLRLSAAAARALPVDAILDRPSSVAQDEIDRATMALLDLLADDVAEAFLDICVIGGDLDVDLGARVTGMETARFRDAVVELVDHGLVQARPDEALPYSVAEPIRDVAERRGAPDRRLRVLDRCVDACIDRARQANASATGDQAGTDLERRFVADLPRYRQALDHLADLGDAERALSLVSRLEMPLYVLGWWAEKSELLDTALAIAGPPSAMRARAHAFRSRPGPMHQFDLAHAEQAEVIAVALGEPRLVAYARHMRSIGSWWSGRTREAVELARDAAATFEEAGRVLEWSEARKFLGVALVLDGEPEAGLAIQQEVLGFVRRELKSPFHIAHNLSYLGHCHRLLGDDTAARADWTEARELCARIGNRGTAIHINIGLGEIAADQGDPELALARAGAALELARAARAATYEPWAWTVAMRAHALGGDLGAATTCVRRALDGLVGAPSGEAVRLATELAHLAVEVRELPTAARLLGVAAATPDRRELPFPSPREAERRCAAELAVTAGLGSRAAEHIDRGRRCSIAEAAGDLLARFA
jgi:DNA-binding SARP family transcriptional activator/DNA polymerase III delta prime subunit